MLELATRFNNTFAHHTASVNGVRLHYVMGGKGEPLVLLHGFPQTWYSWHKVMPALAERYTAIVPDLRGYGDSSKPNDGYDKKTMAEDVYQLVNKLGYEHIFLVAHDVGGMVAYAYAAAHSANVRRLVLAEALIAGLRPGFEDAMDNSQGKGSLWVTFNTVPNLPEALVAGREPTFSPEPLYDQVRHYTTTIAADGDPADVYYPVVPTSTVDQLPIALLLQGALVDKADYSNYAEEVASYGFVVVVPNNQRTLIGPGQTHLINKSSSFSIIPQ